MSIIVLGKNKSHLKSLRIPKQLQQHLSHMMMEGRKRKRKRRVSVTKQRSFDKKMNQYLLRHEISSSVQ